MVWEICNTSPSRTISSGQATPIAIAMPVIAMPKRIIQRTLDAAGSALRHVRNCVWARDKGLRVDMTEVICESYKEEEIVV